MPKPVGYFCDHVVVKDLCDVFGQRFERLTANEKYRLNGLLGVFASVQFDDVEPNWRRTPLDSEGYLDLELTGNATPSVRHFLDEMCTYWGEEPAYEAVILRPIMAAIAIQLCEGTYAQQGSELTDRDIDQLCAA